MITNFPYIYIYATNRDDGMAYAVGVAPEHGPANGSVALFQDASHAELFVAALATLTGGTAETMPSVRPNL